MSLSHVVYELAWQFLEGLLGKQSRVVFEIIERYELHDISSSIFTELSREESFVITVKFVHHAEISITNSDNNDCKRVVGSSDNLINCSFHIINHTISNDQENLELLVLIITWIRLAHAIDGVENFTEMGWSI